MKYQRLGRTDLNVSQITYGCMELGGGPWEVMEDEYNLRLLDKAFDLGITTFDTAESYGGGHSEEVVGRFLKGKRDRCVVATKVSREHLWPADVRRAIEGSLRRLNTDYVDLYYIHWPNDSIPIGETMSELVKLKEEGLIRAIGVSNFSVAQLTDALKYGRVDAHQPEYNLLQREIEGGLLGCCAENEISVLSYNSIAKGILTGSFHFGGVNLKEDDFRRVKKLFLLENMRRETPLLELVRDIAASKGISLSQVAIAWLLHRKGMTSAIVGTQNEKHFLDNVGAVDVVLSENEMESLNETSARVLAELTEA